ncbi:MAG: RNA polymerase factor sigma-54 [Xanthomonadaceae bacterium]|jgi:RNA polymerase sigma-54 factor|nr:RNA polymerase factor sigma-54 [Xanthomonadaceae bacterium]
MKAKLQTSLGQNLVMTPQLRQAIRLLQLSSIELQQEITQAVESNPLLEWEDEISAQEATAEPVAEAAATATEDEGANDIIPDDAGREWSDEEAQRADWEAFAPTRSGGFDGDDATDIIDRVAEEETLETHLLWQLHLSHLSPRDRRIGASLIDYLDDDGYLRVPLSTIAEALLPDTRASEDNILTVLFQLQRFDPVGIAARDLSECLLLQLEVLPEDTPGRALARCIAGSPLLEQLPRSGVEGIAHTLKRDPDATEQAVQLLRSLDPRPGKRIGGLPAQDFVVPDCEVWRERGVWRVALTAHAQPRVGIHRGYEQMIRHCGGADASYMRNQLQEARWLLKSLESRGETLLKVMQCLVREQAGFLEFGEQALRPLTLREVATEIGRHDSTVSRAVAGKYVHTPRGTLPLKAFFASGVELGGGGEASSTAIQAAIRHLVADENPRKPLSDARLAELLKHDGIPVARRTIAKYREAMNIPASHERVRVS